MNRINKSIKGISLAAGLAAMLLAVAVQSPTAYAAATTTASSVPSSNSLQITSLSVDDKEDFVVEPGKMEVFVNPGDTVTKYISVTSRIEKNTKFSISNEDFIGSRDATEPVKLLGDEKSPYSLKDWLVSPANNFALNFGDRVTIPVTITVPKNAAPGGYYAAVIISNAPDVDTSDVPTTGITRIISRIGVLFFVRVNGPINPQGHLEDFKINPSQTFYSSTPSDFQILFNNTGTVYLAPYGEVHIKNFIGTQIADLPIDAYFSLPDSLRYRDLTWNDNGAFRFGRYTATLDLDRNYDGLVDTKTIVFWIIPWKALTICLVGLLVIVGIIWFFFSTFEFRRKK